MVIEQRLMQSMKRTHALLRRRPQDGEGCPQGRRPQGAGHILELLMEHAALSQQQIADMLRIRAQSVSEAAAVLEERGFVRRESAAHDRRVMLLRLTDAGREHAAALARERREHAIRFFGVLTDEEKQTLLAILTRLNDEKEREG